MLYLDAGGAPVPPADLPRARAEPGLYLVKTHERAGHADIRAGEPVIYLVRDGRDAVVSYAHLFLDFVGKPPLWRRFRWRLRGLTTFEGQLEHLIIGKSPFGSWNEHVEGWLARPNTAVMRFEDLIQTPVAVVQRAFQELKLSDILPAAREAPVTFGELKKQNPKFFRKGQAGGWREEMNARLQALFWRYNSPMMRRLAYPESA